MNPYNPGAGPAPQQPGPVGNFGPMPGPMPGYPPQPSHTSIDLSRIASIVVAVAGVVVLFCSLLNLYTVTVMPGNVSDEVNGTVDVGIGFYTMVPFNAPIIAMAIPLLMVIAAATALPGALGRRQGALVSAASAISATLLALVMMFVSPLPDVSLSGDLAREANDGLQSEFGVRSVDEFVDRVVDTGPGAGLIIAFVFGLLASAAAVVVYIRSDDERKDAAGPAGWIAQPPVGPPTGGFIPQPDQQTVPGMHSAPMPTQVAPTPQQGWGGPAGPQ